MRHRTRPVPASFPGPIRRPGATLRWRLRNYKNRFWFQGEQKLFSPDLDCLPGRYGGANGGLAALRLAVRLFVGPAHGRGPACASGFSQRAFSVSMRRASIALAMPSCSRSAFSSAAVSPNRDVADPLPSRLLPSALAFVPPLGSLMLQDGPAGCHVFRRLGGGCFLGLRRLFCDLRPASPCAGQGCIFEERAIRLDGAA